jgi:drug/metabolite transporter (DMT)-like permease
MGALIKALLPRYPAPELAAFRNIFGLVPTIAMLWMSADWQARGRPVVLARWRLATMRGVMVAFAQFFFYSALLRLEFATVSTLVSATPLFVTALSVPVLGQRVGAWRWSAVAAGFLGAVLIIGPGTPQFTWAALLPLAAALCYAGSTITAPLFGREAPTPLINAWSSGGALIGALILSAATTGFVPVASAQDAALIAAMGMVGGSGVLCLIFAYRMARPATLTPFEYFGILFSFFIGWAAFGEAPVERLFPGVLLIVGAGLAIVWRERRAGRG